MTSTEKYSIRMQRRPYRAGFRIQGNGGQGFYLLGNLFSANLPTLLTTNLGWLLECQKPGFLS